MKEILVNGDTMSIEDVCLVADGAKVCLPKEKSFFDTLQKARDFLLDYIKKGYPTYGVTTGFGDSCDGQISSQKAALLQKSIVHFHGIGLGPYFSRQQCRAIVVARLNSNVKGGHSAVRVELALKMQELLNKDVIPAIPQIGSVGASGDLTPLSYLAAVIMGERKVYYKGDIVDTSTAFQKENITPLPLEAKEGLALMNGTSAMTGIICLSYKHALRLSNISDFLTACACEVLKGKDVPFRHKVSLMKNHTGQIESAKKVYDIIKDSSRVYNYERYLKEMGALSTGDYRKTPTKIQDRYSIRCAPQINGVLRDTLHFAQTLIQNEVNSANDNPLVDISENALYNTGNFYGGHICAAADYLRIALANISDMADKQAELLIDGKFNHLTPNLIPFIKETDADAGLHFGFKAAQITISALRAEIQQLAAPVSIHSSPTEALNQDKVSLGTISARKLQEQIDLLFLQFAVHTLAACQAMDLCGTKDFSPFSKKVYENVRKMSDFVQEDRPLDKDANAIATWLKQSPLFL